MKQSDKIEPFEVELEAEPLRTVNRLLNMLISEADFAKHQAEQAKSTSSYDLMFDYLHEMRANLARQNKLIDELFNINVE